MKYLISILTSLVLLCGWAGAITMVVFQPTVQVIVMACAIALGFSAVCGVMLYGDYKNLTKK